MSETYSAGIATAYGSAKRAGYTGSYADFCAAMAAITAPSATASGLPAGSDPTAAYNDGVFAFGIPKGDKGDTGATGPQGPEGATGATGNGIASIAKTATVGKTDTYTITYTDGTTTTFDVTNGEVTEAQMEAELTKKANVDGYYQDMTVGNAEQLVSTIGKADETPYIFRTTGGSVDVGDRMKLKKVVGVSVGWNQIQKNTVSRESNGITYTFSDGKLSVTGTATDASYWLTNNVDLNIDFYANHVYLFDVGNGAYDVSSVSPLPYRWYVAGVSGVNIQKPTLLYKPTGNFQGNMQFRVYTGTTIDMAFMPQIFDLTLALGSTIADYVYTLESATPGSGIAKLKSWGFFRKPYYAYNAGEMLSVSGLQSHDEVEFNQWDEGWEVGSITAQGADYASTTRIRSKGYNPILPDTTYHVKSDSTADIHFYDADKNHIYPFEQKANTTFTTPSDAAFFRFCLGTDYGTTYKNDVCFNLHWDGERDGEYAPYVKHSYPLDSSLTLRGIPKLDANNNLYYDGDEYLPDGQVSRNFSEGQMTYTYLSGLSSDFIGYVSHATYGNMIWVRNWNYQDAKLRQAGGIDAVCNLFPVHMHDTNLSNSQNRTYFEVGSITTVADFLTYVQAKETAGSGLFIVYEKGTPETETAEPYTEYQIVDGSGMEEFVSTSIVPVGNETFYLADLKGKLEDLPTIPEAPTTNGTYVLKATVSSGVATYSWVSE